MFDAWDGKFFLFGAIGDVFFLCKKKQQSGAVTKKYRKSLCADLATIFISCGFFSASLQRSAIFRKLLIIFEQIIFTGRNKNVIVN